MPLLNLFGGSSSRNYGAKLTELFTVVNSTSDNILSNQIYSVTPFFASKGCGSIVHTISPTLPTGLSINSSTGEISGTPTQLIAATDFTITARDRCGATVQSTFNLTVYSPSQATVSPVIGGDTLVDAGALSLATCGTWTITPDNNFTATVKMWGGGGGASGGIAGAGGYATGSVDFSAGVAYQFIVGCAGSGGNSSGRTSGSGGGGTGIKIVSGNVPVLIAGGGGGGGLLDSISGPPGGGGGGTSGADGNSGGGGGTQSAAGAGGAGRVPLYVGAAGSGGNGGQGFPGTGTGGGGTGYGNGGAGGNGTPYLDAGGAGGGGGYFGGGGGGSLDPTGTGGGGGGGGSGYANPTYTSGVTFLVSGTYQANPTSDPTRGTSGDGGFFPGNGGQPGKIVTSV